MYETKTQSTCLCTLIPIIYKGSIASFISSCDFYLAQPDRNNTAFYDSILGCRISISFRGLISHKYQQSTFLNKTITKKWSCPFVPLVTIESKAELFTDSLFEELRHNTRLNKLICSNISNCLFQGHLHGSTASVKIVW